MPKAQDRGNPWSPSKMRTSGGVDDDGITHVIPSIARYNSSDFRNHSHFFRSIVLREIATRDCVVPGSSPVQLAMCCYRACDLRTKERRCLCRRHGRSDCSGRTNPPAGPDKRLASPSNDPASMLRITASVFTKMWKRVSPITSFDKLEDATIVRQSVETHQRQRQTLPRHMHIPHLHECGDAQHRCRVV